MPITPITIVPNRPEPVGDAPEMHDSPVPKDLERRLLAVVEKTLGAYKRHHRADDVRNLDYFRGEVWKGDATLPEAKERAYQAQQNEVFPAVDSIVSALALDVPQVEAIGTRVRSYGYVSRAQDEHYIGQRVVAPLNMWAHDDDLDSTVASLVLGGCIFRRGGLVKTSWSPEDGCVIWRPKLPWHLHQDPDQPRIEDAKWCFETFELPMEDLIERIESGVYRRPPKAIRPDVLPRDVYLEAAEDKAYEDAREATLVESVNMVEFWDFRRHRLYHMHQASGAVLMVAEASYGNPYRQLLFTPPIGQPTQPSIVDLLAPGQLDINILLSARREWVDTLAPRTGMNADFFPDDDARNSYTNSSPTKPFIFRKPPNANVGEMFYRDVPAQTTPDFNRHIADTVTAGRYAVGLSAMNRGVSENIRTAEEASAIRANTDGRQAVKMRRVVRVVRGMFENGLAALQWAVRNQEHSRIDLRRLHEECIADVDLGTWARELAHATTKFRVLPFSPAMEDRYARRDSLSMLLPQLPPQVLAQFDEVELAREVQELYGMRPSVLRGNRPAAAPPGIPGGAPGALLPGGSGVPGMDALGAPPLADGGGALPPPEILAGLTGGAGGPGAGGAGGLPGA